MAQEPHAHLTMLHAWCMHDQHLSRCLQTSRVAERNFWPASAAGAAAQHLWQSSASSAGAKRAAQSAHACQPSRHATLLATAPPASLMYCARMSQSEQVCSPVNLRICTA